MPRFALVKSGVVANVAKADSGGIFSGYSAVVQLNDTTQAEVAPGWLYDGTAFQNPAYGLSLEDAKQQVYHQIDRVTNEIILRGFEYNGFRFPLSGHAQLNYVAMYAAAPLIAPTAYTTYGDDSVYPLPTAADIQAFCAAAIASVKGSQEAGAMLKMQVSALTTVAEVLAFQDPR